MMGAEYDPLSYDVLARNLLDEFIRRPPQALSSILTSTFDGAGVYALYYKGDLSFYAGIRSLDAQTPIYAGKASAPGARTGVTVARGVRTPALRSRLRAHHGSISAAESRATTQGIPGLRVADFQCRYLVTIPLWITLAERLLLERYKPLWNSESLPGFGIHVPGERRARGSRSWWDTLHPGRVFADEASDTDRQGNARTPQVAIERVLAYLAASDEDKIRPLQPDEESERSDDE